jgi:hypothetical protein
VKPGPDFGEVAAQAAIQGDNGPNGAAITVALRRINPAVDDGSRLFFAHGFLDSLDVVDGSSGNLRRFWI